MAHCRFLAVPSLPIKDSNQKNNVQEYENIVIEDFNERCDEEATYSLIDMIEKENKYLNVEL